METSLCIRIADPGDHEAIFRLRHEVYAQDLGQYETRADGRLPDALVGHNVYLLAEQDGEMLGFISVTPPDAPEWSLERHFSWDEIPWEKDAGLYEVRALTLRPEHRGGWLGVALMYAGLRWVESRGGQRIIAMVRDKAKPYYARVGMTSLGAKHVVGRVNYELMGESVAAIRAALGRVDHTLGHARETLDWRLPFAFRHEPLAADHGGAFFEAIGDEFQSLERRQDVINADVLDAWFPPAPAALEAIQAHLGWLARTSPPVHAEGLVRAIARARGVPPSCLLPAGGSSRLIYLAFPQWLDARSRALVVEPTYSEYPFILERLVRCTVDRWTLRREDNYQLDFDAFRQAWGDGYDLVVIVNPNNPTGQLIPGDQLKAAIAAAPAKTRFWIDEAYLDYAGAEHSLEAFAATHDNVCVCKSLSKVYGLSGLRAAYLCGSESTIAELRRWTEPWAVGLPAQVAAVKALESGDYYRERHVETARLRDALRADLQAIDGVEVVAGNANFLLFHLSDALPPAARLVEACQCAGLYLRDLAPAGRQMGDRALRVAVKDAATNDRITAILRQTLATPANAHA